MPPKLRSSTPVEKVDPLAPQSAAIQKAAAVIRSGGIVVYPTRSLYGLGADPFSAAAVARLFQIKGRSAAKPILLLVRGAEDIARLVKKMPAAAEALAESLWPGGLTLVLPAHDRVPLQITGGSGRIGLRLPAHPTAVALVSAVGAPITATSANLSGAPGVSHASDLSIALAAAADLILDSGVLKGGSGSTVVDVSGPVPVVLRRGSIPSEKILTVLAKAGFNQVDIRE